MEIRTYGRFGRRDATVCPECGSLIRSRATPLSPVPVETCQRYCTLRPAAREAARAAAKRLHQTKAEQQAARAAAKETPHA